MKIEVHSQVELKQLVEQYKRRIIAIEIDRGVGWFEPSKVSLFVLGDV